MSSCQIAFVHGDHSEHVAVVIFDKNVNNPYSALQLVAAKELMLADVDPSDIFFMYEDDDGDYVTLSNDADALEAFAIHEDAGQDDILLTVKVKSPAPVVEAVAAESKSNAGENAVKSDDELLSDSEVKEEVPQYGAHTFLDENFVLEFCAFLSDPVVRQVIPEVAANLAAGVLKKASAQQLFDVAFNNAVMKQKNLLNQEWPFAKSWADAYNAWVANLTDDQLGKVAFQIPIVAARLVAKREKLHKAIFVKHKSLGKLLKIAQFDFGVVDFSALLESASKSATGEQTVGHIGTVCAVCSASPIQGTRYRCMICPSFDMCENCEAKAAHPTDHAMMKFRSSAAGYVGLTHASALYGKKAVKHQLKAMKREAKLAKKAEKGEKHGKHHYSKKHGKHGLPPEYVQSMSFAAVAAGANKPPVQGSYAPVSNPSSRFPPLNGKSYGPVSDVPKKSY